MTRLLLAALASSATAATDAGAAPTWHEWKRLGDAGDRALSAGEPAAAEAKYREALALRASLGKQRGVDPHLSRLAAALAAQGKCDGAPGDGHALLAFLALQRGDVPAATAELEAAAAEIDRAATCPPTVLDEVLALLRWIAGRDEEARALHARALEARCRPLQGDPLDEAAAALNDAWTAGDGARWAKAVAAARKKLGGGHPLLALALAKKSGAAPPARSACASRR